MRHFKVAILQITVFVVSSEAGARDTIISLFDSLAYVFVSIPDTCYNEVPFHCYE